MKPNSLGMTLNDGSSITLKKTGDVIEIGVGDGNEEMAAKMTEEEAKDLRNAINSFFPRAKPGTAS